MYLFFDTETTGLPTNWKAPVTDTRNWPRMVQLAWRSYGSDGSLQALGDSIIRPDGFVIPKDVVKVHGITHEMALEKGEPLLNVLEAFIGIAGESSILVAHNMSFDEKIVGAELVRAKKPDLFSGKKKVCTMLGSTDFCRIPSQYGYKWPKLSELHFKLFGTWFQEAHNASMDIEITAKCFWELRKRRLL